MNHLAEPNSSSPDAAVLDIRTRSRLLSAAVRVFDRKGYAAASVREIVEQAGVTKPALYYHFGSKEHLLVAVLEEAARQFGVAMDQVAEHGGSTRERLLHFADVMFAMFSEHASLVRVAHAVFLGPVEAAPHFDFLVFERQANRAIERIVSDGLAKGRIRPASARDIALALTGLVQACLARKLHPGFEPVGAGDVRRILELVFDGILTDRCEQGAQTT